MKKAGIVLLVAGTLFFSGCVTGYKIPPGHDPAGPGNSENAPGHNKVHIPPGQAKKILDQ